MKIKNVIFGLMITLIFIPILMGCARINDTSNNDKDNVKQEEQAKGNCEVKECIKQLNSSNTLEEINDIIGFEGEKNEYSEKYIWKLTDKEFIEATFNKEKNTVSINANIDKTTLIDEFADFSEFTNIKKNLESGKSYTYKEMVKLIGGVEGTLAGKTSTSERYIWVDKNERTFSATFSTNNKGKASIVSLK